jgi:hypothetical protein
LPYSLIMKQSRYRSFFHSVSEITTLYVGLLALVGLLTSVGFFKFRVEPSLKMLAPVYVFDMQALITAFNSCAPGTLLPAEWRAVSNGFAVFRNPYGKNLAGDRLISSAMVPFQEVNSEVHTNLPSWATPSNPGDLFYHLGLTNDPSTYSDHRPNFSAIRSDDEKRYGVSLPIAMNYNRLALDRGFVRLKENPLARCREIIPRHDPPQYADAVLLNTFSQATFVYSIVSVGNYSSEPIENIRLNVANSFWSPPVKLVGWSDVPQALDGLEKSQGYRVSIERLEPNQSVELVFRGHSLLRESQVSLASSWTFDKTRIALWMIVIFVLTVVLYCGDYLAAKVKAAIRRRRGPDAVAVGLKSPSSIAVGAATTRDDCEVGART